MFNIKGRGKIHFAVKNPSQFPLIQQLQKDLSKSQFLQMMAEAVLLWGLILTV